MTDTFTNPIILSLLCFTLLVIAAAFKMARAADRYDNEVEQEHQLSEAEVTARLCSDLEREFYFRARYEGECG